jgi:hypothetical protein
MQLHQHFQPMVSRVSDFWQIIKDLIGNLRNGFKSSCGLKFWSWVGFQKMFYMWVGSHDRFQTSIGLQRKGGGYETKLNEGDNDMVVKVSITTTINHTDYINEVHHRLLLNVPSSFP